MGTSIGLFVRNSDKQSVIFGLPCIFGGKNKRADLEASLKTQKPKYKTPSPKKTNRFSLLPLKVRDRLFALAQTAGIF